MSPGGVSVGAITIRFAVQGDVQLARRIEGVLGRTEDLTPALRRIADDFHAYMAEVFASEGGATRSGDWAPLSPAYAAWKARRYPGAKILHLRGAMEASLAGGAAGTVETLTGTSLEIGTAVVSRKGYPYPRAHQWGTARMPARKLLDLSDAVQTRWMHILSDHVRIEE